MKPNRLKERIRGGEVLVGTFMFTSSPAVMEILGHAGLDFVIVDTEHATTSPFDTVTLGNLVTGGHHLNVCACADNGLSFRMAVGLVVWGWLRPGGIFAGVVLHAHATANGGCA